jgi:hypothetical protein
MAQAAAMTRPSALASLADRRDFKRTSTSLRGKVFPGGLDCVIHDYGPRGARIGFAAAPPCDEKLVLVVWTTGLAYEAVRRWSAGAEIGVQFGRPVDLRRTVPAHLLDIKAQWLDRRRRLNRRHLYRSGAIEGWVSPREVRVS